MQDIIIFISATLTLAFLSRNSLRRTGLNGYSHGFYRFFAWECMLALFVLNQHAQFDDYYSSRHIISNILFLLSLLLVLSGVSQLRLKGNRDRKRNEVPLLAFEKTTTLVSNGIYRYIRHPMYSSLLMFCWGLFLQQPSLSGGMFASSASVFVIMAARVEEKENLNYFGEAYREYMKRTRKFLPFIV